MSAGNDNYPEVVSGPNFVNQRIGMYAPPLDDLDPMLSDTEDPAPLVSEWTFDAADPYATKVIFWQQATGAKVPWLFARELVRDAVLLGPGEAAGQADVRFSRPADWPASIDRDWLQLDLRSGAHVEGTIVESSATLLVPARKLGEYLARTTAIVALGAESEHYRAPIDRFIARTLPRL